MEGDDGLAGARPTLHDEHAGLRRADDLVLLGLDRGDDVPERAGAAPLERGEQRRVAAQLRVVAVRAVAGAVRPIAVPLVTVRDEAVVVTQAEVPAAEQLVLDAEHRAALDDEVAAPHESHRLGARRPVERLGDGRPPVDHDRLGLLVGHGEPADVERLGRRRRLGVAVDPPEHERGVTEIEVGEALDQRLVERVALETGLERAAEVGLGEVAQAPRRLPGALEALVGVIDVGLLGGQFGVLLRHSLRVGRRDPLVSSALRKGAV